MGAPVATARQTPTGQYLTDGWQALITFAKDPNLSIWEIAVTPSGVTNGTPRKITNQWSGRIGQKAPNHSNESTPMKVTFHYDPSEIPALRALVGRRDTITTTYPTGATFAEFGYASDLEFSELRKDSADAPTGTLTIQITDTDPATCEAAEGVFVDGTGTQSVC